MISLAVKPLRDLKRHLAAFSGNARGLAAVEFAIILPVMLVTLFGVIGTTAAISIDRKVTLIARTLSDLTSQGSSVTDNDINNFFEIGSAMLTPYRASQNPVSGGPLRAVITELYVDPNSGVARVQWSKANEAASTDTDMVKSVGDVVDIPSSLVAKDAGGKILRDQYFILSDVRYKYAPSILPGIAAVPLKEITYTRPRMSKPLCVLLNPASQSDPCPKI